MSHMISIGSKMLILFLTIVVMSSINITSAAETTKQTEVMESTILRDVIHGIGNFFYGSEIGESRTFARIKKLQAAMLPLMFKLGVLATIVKIILLLSLKAVLIGKLLLFINLGFVIAKIATWKSHEQHNNWQPPSWPNWYPPQQAQAIHVHIHRHDNDEPHHYPEVDHPYPPTSNTNNLPYGAYHERYDSGLVNKPTIVHYDDRYTERRPTKYYAQS